MCQNTRYVVAPGANSYTIRDEPADVTKISSPLCVYAEEGTDAAQAIRDTYYTKVVCACNDDQYYSAIQENEESSPPDSKNRHGRDDSNSKSSDPFDDLTVEKKERVKVDESWTDEQAQLAAELAQTDVEMSHIRPFGSEKVKFWYEQNGHKKPVFRVIREHDYRVSSISHFKEHTAVSTAPVDE